METRNFTLGSAGFSLIETLIASAVASIIAMGMMSMLTSNQNQVKHLDQKLDILSTKNLLQQFFSNGSVCTCQFGPTNTFNSTDPSGAQSIALTQIKQDCGSNLLLQLNQRFPSGLVVSGISLSDLKPIAGSQWIGNWTVTFNNMVGAAMSPIKIGQVFTADTSTPSAAKVSSCLGSGLVFKQQSIVAIANFPFNGSQNVDFKTYLPASDQPNVVAIQVSIETLNDVVPTSDIGAGVTFSIDGNPMFNFYYDTGSNNEHWQLLSQSLVSPGPHTIQMSTVRANTIGFTFRITGYLVKT